VADYFVIFKSGVMASLNIMMNAEQGASTSVWVAVSRELEGRGGKYLERNQIREPAKMDGFKPIDPGYFECTYDEEKAGKLYDHSLKLVRL
jgi:hypothetical protein